MLHQGQAAVQTWVGLRGVEGSAVAVGRRVDKAQKALWPGWGRSAVVTVLGTHVHGAAARQLAGTEDVIELTGVVVVKEDVVPHQRKAARAAMHRPGHGRQRALVVRRGRNRALDVHAQQTLRQRVGVSVVDHHIGVQHLATFQPHALDTAVLHQDALAAAAVDLARSALRGQPAQGLGQGVHAAFQRPHPALLHMRHQHQGGGGLPG